MEETEKEDEGQLYTIILKNSYSFHPEEPLPNPPWFSRYNNQALSLLQGLAKEAGYDHKRFSKQASKLVVYYKGEKEKESLKRASLLRDSIDIAELLKKISDYTQSSTCLFTRVVKSQSTLGPIIVELILNTDTMLLEEGDKLDLVVELDWKLKINLILDDGDQKKTIAQSEILFRKIVNETHYLKAVEKNELDGSFQSKGKEYDVIVQIKLKLSREDRLEILYEKQKENEEQLQEENQSTIIYKALLESLCIEDTEPGYESLIQSPKHRENCCRYCLVT